MGEQFSFVIAVVAVEVTRFTRFFSRASACTASATEELVRSVIISTASVSNQVRAIDTPRSGLFWWSAPMISMRRPFTVGPKAATAIFAAAMDPGPAASP